MGKITEDNIDTAIREIRMALLEADVNYEIVKEFTNNVKTKALGLEVEKSLKPEELFIKLVKDELVSLLGENYVPLEVNKKPTIIMLVGLQGSGKTTTCGKLANLVRKKYSKKPLLVACDIYRPAAIEQLQTIGSSLNIPGSLSFNPLKKSSAPKNFPFSKANPFSSNACMAAFFTSSDEN